MTLQQGTTYVESKVTFFIMLQEYVTSSTAVYDQWNVT